EVIEAVGMRFTGGADWLLRDALVRQAPKALADELRERMSQPAPVIRLAEQILELTPEDAATGHPVELVGVVIRSLPGSGTLYLRDTSGCVRVDIRAADSPMLKTGTGIRLRGVTISGAFAPEVRGSSVEHWGTALLPEARPITLEQAMTGSEQGERVELRGCVTSVDAGPQLTRMTLSSASGEFTAILASEHDYRWLLGTVIAARGICQVTANERRQLTGIELWLSSGDDIQVEQQALSDPFSAPLRRIGSLRQFSRKSAINYWARVVGVVTHHLPGRLLFVQDGGSGLLILSAQDTPLDAGDLVEATGIPGFESERLVLR